MTSTANACAEPVYIRDPSGSGMVADITKVAPLPRPCVADSDWGCEARKKLGVARGALSTVADMVTDAPDFDGDQEIIDYAERIFKETGQPQPCTPAADSSSHAAIGAGGGDEDDVEKCQATYPGAGRCVFVAGAGHPDYHLAGGIDWKVEP